MMGVLFCMAKILIEYSRFGLGQQSKQQVKKPGRNTRTFTTNKASQP